MKEEMSLSDIIMRMSELIEHSEHLSLNLLKIVNDMETLEMTMGENK